MATEHVDTTDSQTRYTQAFSSCELQRKILVNFNIYIDNIYGHEIFNFFHQDQPLFGLGSRFVTRYS